MTASSQAAANQQLLPSARDSLGNITVQKWIQIFVSFKLVTKSLNFQRSISIKFSEFESKKFVLKRIGRARKTFAESIIKPSDNATKHHHFWTRRWLGWCRNESRDGSILQLAKCSRKLCRTHANFATLPATRCRFSDQQLFEIATKSFAFLEQICTNTSSRVLGRMVFDAYQLSVLASANGNARPNSSRRQKQMVRSYFDSDKVLCLGRRVVDERSSA